MSNRILFISQEITPYLPGNRMSVLGQKLPQCAQDNGYEVRIFMPKYGCINERRNQLHEVIRLSGMNVVIDDTDHPLIIKVASLQPSRMQVYFIDSDDYFIHRSLPDIEIKSLPEDNDERLIFFAYGVLETVKKLRWEPAIINCSGWISSLAPLFIKTLYSDDPMFRNAKVVYSLYGDAFEGNLNPKMIDKLLENGLPVDNLRQLGGDIDYKALSRLAMDSADAIVVSAADVDPELVEYARTLGKPLMEYPGDDTDLTPYINFYNSL